MIHLHPYHHEEEARLLQEGDTTGSNSIEDDLTFGNTPVEKATVVMNQVGALISILSIVCIILEACHDLSNKKGTVVTRTLLSWSVGSMSLSLGFLMGTWPIPRSLDHYIWGASGTQGTCTLQGVLLITGLFMSVLWDVALSLTYVWMVRYNWPSAKLEKWEKVIHAIIWPLVLIFLILGLLDQAYNASRDICYLSPAPYGCELENDDLSTCNRGLNSYSLLAILVLVSIIGIVVAIVSMAVLYCTVRALEKKNERYTKQYTNSSKDSNLNSRESGRSRNSTTRSSVQTKQTTKLSQQVGIQGILYSSIWLLVCLPTAIVAILWGYTGIVIEGVYLVTQSIGVLYGFWYSVVYLRRREEMKTSYGRIFKSFVYCFYCKQHRCCKREEDEPLQDDAKQRRDDMSTVSLAALSGPLPNSDSGAGEPSQPTTPSSEAANDVGVANTTLETA